MESNNTVVNEDAALEKKRKAEEILKSISGDEMNLLGVLSAKDDLAKTANKLKRRGYDFIAQFALTDKDTNVYAYGISDFIDKKSPDTIEFRILGIDFIRNILAKGYKILGIELMSDGYLKEIPEFTIDDMTITILHYRCYGLERLNSSYVINASKYDNKIMNRDAGSDGFHFSQKAQDEMRTLLLAGVRMCIIRDEINCSYSAVVSARKKLAAEFGYDVFAERNAVWMNNHGLTVRTRK